MTATPPNSNPDQNKPSNSSHPSESISEQSPAERDAERVSKHHPTSFVVKILLFLLALFLLVCAVLYYMAGTSRGTQFFIDKIINETGVMLEYGEGNLRDGLLVKSATLSASEDIDVSLINAYVKIGWRALFMRQVHLRDASIESIVITNKKPPTGEPFDYKTLNLPVDLRFDSAQIDRIVYNQVTKEPVIVTDVLASDLSWVDTKVEVGNGNLQYADIVHVGDLSGYIDLQGNYPLDADAVVRVQALEKVYVDPLSVQVNGSLKRTTGKLSGQYNGSDIEGTFVAQGVDKNAPFSAKLWWDEVTLPYAEGQDIRLNDGLAVASGVTSDIALRVNTELIAKDIPAGQYKARATIANNQMMIDRLTAQTEQGWLLTQGVLDWQDSFEAKVLVTSRDYAVRPLLPEVAQPYAPRALDGKLAVVFQLENSDGLMQINADLKQRDGEQINAKIVQGKKTKNTNSQKQKNPAPWLIDARWQNYVRSDVPNIGLINSPNGTASVTVQDNRLWVDADAQVNELNVAPKGRYQIDLAKVGDRIDLSSFAYDGIMGDLVGDGTIVLANDKKDLPLTWQIDAKTSELLPQAFKDDLPVEHVQGVLSAQGVMESTQQNVNGKMISGQRHDVTVNNADLITRLTHQAQVKNSDGTIVKTESRQVRIDGKGNADVALLDGQLQTFDARFDGAVDTQGVPAGNWQVDASGDDMAGDTQYIHIKSLKHQGEAGGLTATGDVTLGDRIVWDVTANAQKFDVGFFAPQTEAIVTGDLKTSGSWRNATGSVTNQSANIKPVRGQQSSSPSSRQSSKKSPGRLENFAVKFDGSVDTPKLPKGTLNIDASGDASVINIKTLKHQGKAGGLTAQGKVDVRQGLTWNIKAVMNNFNVGYFVVDAPSRLTGRIQTAGKWQDEVQSISISNMNLSGQLQNKPITASGNLNAVLSLPKDMTAYTDLLKQADTNGKTQRLKKVVQTLKADNLKVQWADNYVVANGDANKLQAKVSIRSLDSLTDSFVQGLSGQLSGGMTLVQGSEALPTIFVNLTGENINLPKFTLKQGKLIGKAVNLGKKPSKMLLTAQRLSIAERQFDDVQALFSGTEQSHTLVIKGTTKTDATDVSLTANLKGGLNLAAKRWQGVLGGGKVATDYVLLKQHQPAELVASFAENASIKIASHCWQTSGKNAGSGSFCLRDNLVASSAQGNIDVTLQSIDTSLLAPFMPNDLSWNAKVNGKAKVGWQQGKRPNINVTLYSDDGKLGLTQDTDITANEPQTVQMGYERVSVIAKSVAKGLQTRVDINTGNGALGYADVLIDPYGVNKPISGKVVLEEWNLAVLKPFFPAIRSLRGNVTLASSVKGTLTSPQLYGDFAVKNTAFALLDAPISLNNINAKGQVQGKTATFAGQFMSGEGEGSLSGTIDWKQDLQAKFSVQGNKLVVTQPPLLFAQVSPDLDVIVKPKRRYVNIEGVISIPTATLRPPEANGDVITQSEDVVVLDRRLTGNLDEILAVTEPWSINADIGVDLGKDVKFRGFGAVLPLAGALNITQQGKGRMRATGLVQVSRQSTIEAFGQNLELQYGQVRFAGDVLNPRLSIEASKEISGQTVGVRVKGQVSDPNITVFNDAGLTEQQAMNALVTGRIGNSGAIQTSEEGFKSEVSNTLAAAGLSYGLSGTRNLTNSIGQAFGLQRLTLDASGADNDANVNVTGYITPDLYIRYGVGVFSAQSTLSLRYQLTRRVFIEATSATENAVDVVYSFQF